MDAIKQGFAKGFSGEDTDTITPQAMPTDAGTAVEGGEPGTLTGAEGAGGEPIMAAIISEIPADVVSDAGPAGEAGEPAAGEGEGEPGEEAGHTPDVEAGAAGAFPEPGEDPGEMSQSEKSWNGRLTAREKELKARADELAAREQELSSKSLPSYAEAVESLTNDFGEGFMGYFKAFVIGAVQEAFDMTAKQSIGEIVSKIDDITQQVHSAFGQVHSEMISAVHEDFEDIAKSEEFKAYIDGLGEEEKAQALAVIESGSPRQVVRLLTAFKKTIMPDAAQEDTGGGKYDSAALDAAAGLRSSGGRAPSLAGDSIAAGDEVDRFRAGFNS